MKRWKNASTLHALHRDYTRATAAAVCQSETTCFCRVPVRWPSAPEGPRGLSEVPLPLGGDPSTRIFPSSHPVPKHDAEQNSKNAVDAR